jgi:hypothetical protein
MAVERQVRTETCVPPILGKEKTPRESQFREVWGLAEFFCGKAVLAPALFGGYGGRRMKHLRFLLIAVLSLFLSSPVSAEQRIRLATTR